MTTEQKTGVAAGTAIDQARVEQFAGDLVQKLNGAASPQRTRRASRTP